MQIYPAIDLFEGKAVRLLKGDYNRMTVYSDRPAEVAADFATQGAARMHIVDLEGAKNGETPNFELISRLKRESRLFVEVGGGIRSLDIIARYLEGAGVDRVILGTAAATQPEMLEEAIHRYGNSIAVGIDIRNGFLAIHGWTEDTRIPAADFLARMSALGVNTAIVTDISRDGAMRGPNTELYSSVSAAFSGNIIASGGVSTLEDIKALTAMGLHGAIVGKAYYTGAFTISQALEAARC